MRLVNPTFNAYVERLSPGEKIRFAERCGTTVIYLSHLKSGYRLPSLKFAQRIAFVTEGAVPLSSWPMPPDLAAVREPRTRPKSPPEHDRASGARAVTEPLEVEHVVG